MSSKFGGIKFEVEKYDGRTDYLLWEKQVKGVLRAMGLDHLLSTREEYDGEEEFPAKKWRQEQVIAVNAVMLYLKPHIIKTLDDYMDCKSLFKALREKYYRDDASDRLYKKSLLMSLRLKEGNKLRDHLDEFDSLVVDLSNLGKAMEDEDKALLLLSSLPPSYQGLKQVLLYRNLKTISYDEVVSSLLSDDAQKKLGQAHTPSSSGTTLNVNRGRPPQRTNGEPRSFSRYRGKDKARSKSRSRSREQSLERKPITCWKCGKTGHMKRDCRVKQTNQSSANAATDVDMIDLLDDEIL